MKLCIVSVTWWDSSCERGITHNKTAVGMEVWSWAVMISSHALALCEMTLEVAAPEEVMQGVVLRWMERRTRCMQFSSRGCPEGAQSTCPPAWVPHSISSFSAGSQTFRDWYVFMQKWLTKLTGFAIPTMSWVFCAWASSWTHNNDKPAKHLLSYLESLQ